MSRLLCLTELLRHEQIPGGPGTEYRTPRPHPEQPTSRPTRFRGGISRWSPLTESNRRPSPYHGDALPTELRGHAASARSVTIHGRHGREVIDKGASAEQGPG